MENQKKEKTPYYTTKDIAQLENVHTETVRRWVREGVLPSRKHRGINNMNLFSEEDYQTFKKSKQITKTKTILKKKTDDLIFELQFALRQEDINSEDKGFLKSFLKQLTLYREKI